MGVMNCNRKGCEYILCNTYVKGVGYICSGCVEEFEELMGESTEYKEYELLSKLGNFMATEKGCCEVLTVNEFFKKVKYYGT